MASKRCVGELHLLLELRGGHIWLDVVCGERMAPSSNLPIVSRAWSTCDRRALSTCDCGARSTGDQHSSELGGSGDIGRVISRMRRRSPTFLVASHGQHSTSVVLVQRISLPSHDWLVIRVRSKASFHLLFVALRFGEESCTASLLLQLGLRMVELLVLVTLVSAHLLRGDLPTVPFAPLQGARGIMGLAHGLRARVHCKL